MTNYSEKKIVWNLSFGKRAEETTDRKVGSKSINSLCPTATQRRLL
jgi:hypothetical protein